MKDTSNVPHFASLHYTTTNPVDCHTESLAERAQEDQCHSNYRTTTSVSIPGTSSGSSPAANRKPPQYAWNEREEDASNLPSQNATPEPPSLFEKNYQTIMANGTQDKRLRRWMRRQCARKKVTKEEAQKIAQFKEMLAKPIFDQQWEEMYEQLVKYKETHGTVTVSTNSQDNMSESYKKLANWVRHQRDRELKKNQREKLEAIGVMFGREQYPGTVREPKITQSQVHRWNAMCDALQHFKMAHGHVKVPSSTKLYNWVRTQQRSARALQMLPDRRQRLLELGLELTPEKQPPTRTREDPGLHEAIPESMVRETKPFNDEFNNSLQRIYEFLGEVANKKRGRTEEDGDESTLPMERSPKLQNTELVSDWVRALDPNSWK